MFVLGLFSGLKMELNFQRRSIYYLIQIYVPSAMIVVLSWVSNALKVEYPQPNHIFLASDLSWKTKEQEWGGGGGGDVDKRAVLVPFLLRVGREAGGVLVWEVNEDKQEW